MPTSLIEGESLLAVDVGTTTTRAVLFDVVEGNYRFIAVGQSPTTAEAPFRDIGLGVREAIANIQSVTRRVFLNKERVLISPSQPDGTGVDAFVATISAGPAVRTMIVGLLSDVSVESARRLVETTYSRVVDTLSLSDRRRADQQIDDFLRSRPELIVVAGGTDGGASRSIRKMLETVGMACYVTPEEKRPVILFTGNQKLNNDVQELMKGLSPALHFSPNIRPSLDTEDLEPASRELASLVNVARRGQIRGMEELEAWTRGHVLPTSYAIGRMVRFLSQLTESRDGVLSVDLGASAATVAAGLKGKLSLHTYPQFGMGENLGALLQQTSMEDILRWLSVEVSAADVRDYLYQKALYPATIPATVEEYAIAQAVARQNLYLAVRAARRDFPAETRTLRPDLTPAFDIIIASGGVLADAPTLGQGLLLLLDAVQPVGLTHIMLDRNNLLPLLGVSAAQNSILSAQITFSGAFEQLGTVVSALGNASYGAAVLRAKLTNASKEETVVDVKAGEISLLPLGSGESAQLTIQPVVRADAGFGPGRARTLTVSGGPLGVVIDARGRPLNLPTDAMHRRELMKKWLWTLGG
jgi:uncharacterized protein (TIGR01319 family)